MYPTRWRQLSKQSTDNKGLLCCLNLGNVRIISWRRESRREAGGGDQEQAEGLLLGCAFASLPSFFNMFLRSSILFAHALMFAPCFCFLCFCVCSKHCLAFSFLSFLIILQRSCICYRVLIFTSLFLSLISPGLTRLVLSCLFPFLFF